MGRKLWNGSRWRWQGTEDCLLKTHQQEYNHKVAAYGMIFNVTKLYFINKCSNISLSVGRRHVPERARSTKWNLLVSTNLTQLRPSEREFFCLMPPVVKNILSKVCLFWLFFHKLASNDHHKSWITSLKYLETITKGPLRSGFRAIRKLSLTQSFVL